MDVSVPGMSPAYGMWTLITTGSEVASRSAASAGERRLRADQPEHDASDRVSLPGKSTDVSMAFMSMAGGARSLAPSLPETFTAAASAGRLVVASWLGTSGCQGASLAASRSVVAAGSLLQLGRARKRTQAATREVDKGVFFTAAGYAKSPNLARAQAANAWAQRELSIPSE